MKQAPRRGRGGNKLHHNKLHHNKLHHNKLHHLQDRTKPCHTRQQQRLKPEEDARLDQRCRACISAPATACKQGTRLQCWHQITLPAVPDTCLNQRARHRVQVVHAVAVPKHVLHIPHLQEQKKMMKKKKKKSGTQKCMSGCHARGEARSGDLRRGHRPRPGAGPARAGRLSWHPRGSNRRSRDLCLVAAPHKMSSNDWAGTPAAAAEAAQAVLLEEDSELLHPPSPPTHVQRRHGAQVREHCLRRHARQQQVQRRVAAGVQQVWGGAPAGGAASREAGRRRGEPAVQLAGRGAALPCELSSQLTLSSDTSA